MVSEERKKMQEQIQGIIELIEANDGEFTWREAIRIIAAHLQTPDSYAEYMLGRLLSSSHVVLVRGRVVTTGK